MENKTWLWKRKSSEVTNASKKPDILKEKTLLLERALQELNEQLSSVCNESSNKDDLLSEQAKVAEEAIKGWEKAEAEALSFKQKLEDAMLSKEAAEERIFNTEAALEKCMRDLEVFKEDQQLIIHNAAIKLSREQEKARIFEDRLAETNKSLSEAVNETSNLSGILEDKEQLIRDLSESKSKSQANFKQVISKLEYAEKTHASLKYEFCMLQKELEIRNQERDFNLKSADAAHRQQLESLKKIAKLESECQRLRVMIRKRLPGPAAIAKMRSEVDLLGTDSNGYQKKMSNSPSEAFKPRDVTLEDYNSSRKTIASLIERLHEFEEENNILRESLNKKNNELQLAHSMFARAASKLSQLEKNVQERSTEDASDELTISSSMSYKPSLVPISQHDGDEDNVSSAESWASALISEMEHFRNGKPAGAPSKDTAMSELKLMDDFIEMEKLANISEDKSVGSALDSSGVDMKNDAKGNSLGHEPPELTGEEVVQNGNTPKFKEANQTGLFERYPSSLQNLKRPIIHKHHATEESIGTNFDVVRIALRGKDSLTEAKHFGSSCRQIQQTRHFSADSFDGSIRSSRLNTSETQIFPSNIEKKLLKLIELIEGIIQRTRKSNEGHDLISQNGWSTPLGGKSLSLDLYVTRTFIWESCELTNVLEKFVSVCSDLLHGTADLERFASEILLTLDWITNHCFSLQNVPDIKEIIEKNVGMDDTQIDHNQAKKMEKLTEEHDIAKERGVPFLFSSAEDNGTKLKDENELHENEIIRKGSKEKDLEKRLKAASTKNQVLITQLHESEKYISNLNIELATRRDSRGLMEGQIEDPMLINEDIAKQLIVAMAEQKDTEEFLSLESGLKEKSYHSKNFKDRCLELQVKLQSTSSMESSKSSADEENKQERQLQMHNQIAKASERLSVCQETILNLGKQFKALASPQDSPLFDKVIASPASKVKHRTQLLDHIRAEDDANSEELKSPKTKGIICPESANSSLFFREKIYSKEPMRDSVNSFIVYQQSLVKSPGRLSVLEDSDKHEAKADGGSLVLVNKKQKMGSKLLRKFLFRSKQKVEKRSPFQLAGDIRSLTST